jgi:hypothetical protein
LSTIRVPKNLLYLTDRLPKPHYDSVDRSNRKRKEETEDLKRRTLQEATQQSLPEIKKIKQPIARAS